MGLSANGYEAQLRYYALHSSRILAIWEDAFGADKDRVIGVYAAHAANDWTSETILSWEGVREHADVLAVAPYFGGVLGSPERADAVADWSLDRLFGAVEEKVEGENKDFIESQARLADRFGVRLVSYEGGQHLVGSGGTEENEKLTELFIEANRDPRMTDIYLRHLKVWWNAGGDLYALFSSMGEPSKWGSWGLLEYEGSTNPKWTAVQQALSR